MKTKSTNEYRNDITLHLVRISGDLEHIKEKVISNNKHLERINGRLTTAEHSITAIKTIGTTLTIAIGGVLTWLGLDKYLYHLSKPNQVKTAPIRKANVAPVPFTQDISFSFCLTLPLILER